MTPGRREALILAAAGVAAASAGFLLGPILFGSRREEREFMTARFPDAAGRVRQLSEWRGKVLVCNFWATWCAPCREEIPLLVAARAKYGVRGVEVVGIAIDNAAKVGEFTRSLGVTYPILLSETDGLEHMRKLGNSSGGLPYTVFFDREGRVVHRKLGALKAADLEQMLAEMVRG